MAGRTQAVRDFLHSRGDEWSTAAEIAVAVFGSDDPEHAKTVRKLISNVRQKCDVEMMKGSGYRLERRSEPMLPLERRVFVATSGVGKMMHVVIRDDGRVALSVNAEYDTLCGLTVLGLSCRRPQQPERRWCRRCRDELARIASITR